MNVYNSADEIFQAGGTLDAGAPSYVERQADGQLFALVQAGHLCYVLTPRQMGKSSLMIRTAKRLQAIGVRTAVVDLNAIGILVTPDEWYLGVIREIHFSLGLPGDILAWWAQHVQLSLAQRLRAYLLDQVLDAIESNVAIFIDEIDSMLQLNFRDDFFAVLRSIYNARPTTLAYRRITFILLGVASPSDLIQDRNLTPFNIGRPVILLEFSVSEAAPLEAGLEMFFPGQGAELLAYIVAWTNGHPYLTQELCMAAIQHPALRWDAPHVRQLVEQTLLADTAHTEHFKFIRERLRARPVAEQQQLLTLYQRVLQGERIPEDDRSPIHNELKLAGLARVKDNALCIRNEVYRAVFNQSWLKQERARVEAILAREAQQYFQAGGTLSLDNFSYVKRAVDAELLATAHTGGIHFLLASRQMGKTSLLVRVAQVMEAEGARTHIVDLSVVGMAQPERWFYTLAVILARDDDVHIANVETWWQDHREMPPSKRFQHYLELIAPTDSEKSTIIFFDEIDTLKAIDSSTQAQFLQVLYDVFANASGQRRACIIIGTMRPEDFCLLQLPHPATLGQVLTLGPFSYGEATPLKTGLERRYPEEGDRILVRIFHWTGGHPYLTQYLCREVIERTAGNCDDDAVDQVAHEAFLTEKRRRDGNLGFIHYWIRSLPPRDQRRVLQVYRGLVLEQHAPVRKEVPEHQQLLFLGLAREERGRLYVANEIYRQVFDEDWASANLQELRRSQRRVNVTVTAVVVAVATVLLSIAGFYYITLRQPLSGDFNIAVAPVDTQGSEITTSTVNPQILVSLINDELSTLELDNLQFQVAGPPKTWTLTGATPEEIRAEAARQASSLNADIVFYIYNEPGTQQIRINVYLSDSYPGVRGLGRASLVNVSSESTTNPIAIRDLLREQIAVTIRTFTAMEFLVAGKYTEARALLEAADAVPGSTLWDAAIYSALAHIALSQGDTVKAEAFVAEALSVNPNYQWALVEQGDILLAKGAADCSEISRDQHLLESARQMYELVLTAQNSTNDVDLFATNNASIGLGKVLTCLGEKHWAEAERLLLPLSALSTSASRTERMVGAEAAASLGRLYIAAGRPDAAITALDGAIEGGTTRQKALYSLVQAQIALEVGNIANAQALLNQAEEARRQLGSDRDPEYDQIHELVERELARLLPSMPTATPSSL